MRDATQEIICGDALTVLRTMPDCSVQMCVTSPPYFGLRDYGVDGQIGLESSPQEYVAALTDVFHEVNRVLKDDGILWLNLGDSYANDGKWGGYTGGKHAKGVHGSLVGRQRRYSGLKPKDLIGIPWRVAFALQDGGWWLRSDVIWVKESPMPEPVTDRPTSAHEHIFLLAKSESYFYDYEAVKEPSVSDHDSDNGYLRPSVKRGGFNGKSEGMADTGRNAFRAVTRDRNLRNVWTPPRGAGCPEAHFATYPPALIKPCILAGSRPGDTVLDPFFGAGTTGLVCRSLGRNCIGIELNPEYMEIARRRLDGPVEQETLFGPSVKIVHQGEMEFA